MNRYQPHKQLQLFPTREYGIFDTSQNQGTFLFDLTEIQAENNYIKQNHENKNTN